MTTEVDVTLVEAVLPGDALLIHGGVAISRL
jgi:hydrogenase maturation factor